MEWPKRNNMHGNHSDDIIAVFSGMIVTFLSLLLRFDWNLFTVEIVKTTEVLWLGIVGGVGGYLGKQLIDKISKKKNKNGNNNKSKKL